MLSDLLIKISPCSNQWPQTLLETKAVQLNLDALSKRCETILTCLCQVMTLLRWLFSMDYSIVLIYGGITGHKKSDKCSCVEEDFLQLWQGWMSGGNTHCRSGDSNYTTVLTVRLTPYHSHISLYYICSALQNLTCRPNLLICCDPEVFREPNSKQLEEDEFCF